MEILYGMKIMSGGKTEYRNKYFVQIQNKGNTNTSLNKNRFIVSLQFVKKGDNHYEHEDVHCFTVRVEGIRGNAKFTFQLEIKA